MAQQPKQIDRVEVEKVKRQAASKKAYNEQIKLMRALGILPPGAKPKTKHFNLLAAHHNGMAAAGRAISVQRDLAAFESVGGVGAAIMATLTNPKAKATERAIALQAMIQVTKSAPQVVSAARLATEEDNPYLIDDNEVDSIIREFGGE